MQPFIQTFSSMQISDKIQLVGVIVALVIGTISIFISIGTLKQNSKMIRESLRPYIVIYYEMVHLSNQQGYYVIKNFGKSGAYITKFEYDKIIDTLDFGMENINDQFKSIEGLFLAPNQNVLIKLYHVPKELKKADFRICYTSENNKNYKNTFSLNMDVLCQHQSIRTDPLNSSNNDEVKLPKFIYHAIQEAIERKL